MSLYTRRLNARSQPRGSLRGVWSIWSRWAILNEGMSQSQALGVILDWRGAERDSLFSLGRTIHASTWSSSPGDMYRWFPGKLLFPYTYTMAQLHHENDPHFFENKFGNFLFFLLYLSWLYYKVLTNSDDNNSIFTK